jgi:hypothetical protein
MPGPIFSRVLFFTTVASRHCTKIAYVTCTDPLQNAASFLPQRCHVRGRDKKMHADFLLRLALHTYLTPARSLLARQIAQLARGNILYVVYCLKQLQ